MTDNVGLFDFAGKVFAKLYANDTSLIDVSGEDFEFRFAFNAADLTDFAQNDGNYIYIIPVSATAVDQLDDGIELMQYEVSIFPEAVKYNEPDDNDNQLDKLNFMKSVTNEIRRLLDGQPLEGYDSAITYTGSSFATDVDTSPYWSENYIIRQLVNPFDPRQDITE